MFWVLVQIRYNVDSYYLKQLSIKRFDHLKV